MGLAWVQTTRGKLVAMSTIFINAISVREGGSCVVMSTLLSSMASLRPQWHWHVATNAKAKAYLPQSTNTIFHEFPESKLGGARIGNWYEFELLGLLQDVKADLLFSQTNYLPLRKLPCPALLLVQHAGHFSKIFQELQRAAEPGLMACMGWYIKNRWVKASVQKADSLTVQTEALAKEIAALGLCKSENIQVIPHGPGMMTRQEYPVEAPKPGIPLRIGYITKYGVQKNFGTLFQAILQARELGVDCRLVLTLDPACRENQPILNELDKLGLGLIVENHGEISREAIITLYRSLNLFVFPSLCESFGFPLVEAMAAGLPVLVADTPSNREVGGDAAMTFPAQDATHLAQTIVRLVANPSLCMELSKASLLHSRSFSWDKAASDYVQVIERLIRSGTRL
jgi:glycosyltransferase involved in cell wall biosynthesis